MRPLATFTEDGTSEPYEIVKGGQYNVFIEGADFAGGTVGLEVSIFQVSWIPLAIGDTTIAQTSAGAFSVNLSEESWIRATLTGSDSPSPVSIGLGISS